jgi:molybdopterin-biosynthesis enzyme MoeA-like protein
MKDVMIKRNAVQPNEELSEKRKLMALFPSHPEKVQVYYPIRDGNYWVPIVRVFENESSVNILPGIPSLFEKMVSHFFEEIVEPLGTTKFHRQLVGTEMIESNIGNAR